MGQWIHTCFTYNCSNFTWNLTEIDMFSLKITKNGENCHSGILCFTQMKWNHVRARFTLILLGLSFFWGCDVMYVCRSLRNCKIIDVKVYLLKAAKINFEKNCLCAKELFDKHGNHKIILIIQFHFEGHKHEILLGLNIWPFCSLSISKKLWRVNNFLKFNENIFSESVLPTLPIFKNTFLTTLPIFNPSW